MSNSVDPDGTAHYLDLHCFQKPIVLAYGSKRVKPVLGPYAVLQATWLSHEESQ